MEDEYLPPESTLSLRPKTKLFNKKFVPVAGALMLLAAIPVSLLTAMQIQKYFSEAGNELPTECRSGLDVVFVIDWSGSMINNVGGTNTKKKDAAMAAIQSGFVDKLDFDDTKFPDGRKDRVGIVFFNATNTGNFDLAVKTFGLNNPAEAENYQLVKNQLASPPPTNWVNEIECPSTGNCCPGGGGQCTDTSVGLVYAKKILDEFNKKPISIEANKQVVILLTDGKQNSDMGVVVENDPEKNGEQNLINAISNEVAPLKSASVKVFTAFFASTDEELEKQMMYRVLQGVASYPNATYAMNCPTQQSLTDNLSNVLDQFPCCNINTQMVVEWAEDPGALPGAPKPLTVSTGEFHRTSVLTRTRDNVVSTTEKPFVVGSQVSETGNWQLITADNASNNAATAKVTLDTIPTGWEVPIKFCYDRNTGKGCPAEFASTPIKEIKPAAGAPNEMSTFNLNQCDSDLVYGWRAQEICNGTPTMQIRKVTATGEVLTNITGFNSQSIVNYQDGTVSDQGVQDIVPNATGKLESGGIAFHVPRRLKTATNISVEISTDPASPAAGYSIIGSFCENRKTGLRGCPTNANATDPNTRKLTGFGYDCGSEFVYGWIVEPTTNPAPVCAVTSDKTTGTKPLAVSFSGIGNSAPAGMTISEYRWSFDGTRDTTQTGSTTSKTFDTAGTHKGSLVVCYAKDNQAICSSNTCEATVTVTDPPVVVLEEPTCRITATPTSGTNPLSVTFSSTGSTAPSGTTISQYKWKVDGADVSGTSQSSLAKSFTTAGSHSASLIVCYVKDNVTKCSTNSCETTVTVSEPLVQHTECGANFECKTVTGPNRNYPNEPNKNECMSDKDCVTSYYTCDEYYACVKMVGVGNSANACDPTQNNPCDKPEDNPPTGTSGAALAIGATLLIMIIAGAAFLFK